MTRSASTKVSSRATPAIVVLIAGAWLCVMPCALAETASDSAPSITVGTTGQAATLAREGPDAGQMNFEFALSLPARNGALELRVEAAAGPPDLTAPAVCPSRAAGDADPFAASVGETRLVAFQYSFSHDSGDWSLGYVEARSHLDFSAVANDDKTQFAQAAFVNNPTLALPGSRLGLSWQRTAGSGASGHGILLAQDDDAGAFLAGEAWRDVAGIVARLGAWQGRHGDGCGDAHPAERGRGVYAGFDGHLAALRWNLRAGLGRVGATNAAFVGLALEAPLRRGVLGLAAGRERAVAHGGAERARHAELYYRLALPGGLWLVPGLQFSDRAGASADWSAGLRFMLAI